jgi:hypothetical protein
MKIRIPDWINVTFLGPTTVAEGKGGGRLFYEYRQAVGFRCFYIIICLGSGRIIRRVSYVMTSSRVSIWFAIKSHRVIL